MIQPISSVSVERLAAYSTKDAAEIGYLHRFLSDRFTGEPALKSTLEGIINSPFHEQLVARINDGTIVGTATITLTVGSAIGRNAWLEDFVVNPNYQGIGIGSRLWESLVEWCEEHGAGVLEFTSNNTREAAHRFYLSRGATIRDTSCFTKVISK